MAVAGAYILFDKDGGEFAFDCLTGSIHGACHGDAVEFGWQGNDEMEPAEGDGWAELKDDGSLEGEICLLNGAKHPIHRTSFKDFFNSLLAVNLCDDITRRCASRFEKVEIIQ
ncbi:MULTISPECIES: hypothetical protein [unclassified Bradyrhizobium]|uniref:hypothetical protein n=1 Tax=unclassified Bradyrhizobium TaxID=2631580 RepID=UPI00247A9307|nr:MULTISPECIES: hypothetical protein [unclassified Bradyrhizobium]WGS22557.1 hypothetical protein MTX22_13365 [Bradyrhizobium sp. ISRA463]WGS29540.1 hypothetical protein MTX19_11135 [Bradyrhizobium sp. ISRA464]